MSSKDKDKEDTIISEPKGFERMDAAKMGGGPASPRDGKKITTRRRSLKDLFTGSSSSVSLFGSTKSADQINRGGAGAGGAGAGDDADHKKSSSAHDLTRDGGDGKPVKAGALKRRSLSLKALFSGGAGGGSSGAKSPRGPSGDADSLASINRRGSGGGGDSLSGSLSGGVTTFNHANAGGDSGDAGDSQPSAVTLIRRPDPVPAHMQDDADAAHKKELAARRDDPNAGDRSGAVPLKQEPPPIRSVDEHLPTQAVRIEKSSERVTPADGDSAVLGGGGGDDDKEESKQRKKKDKARRAAKKEAKRRAVQKLEEQRAAEAGAVQSDDERMFNRINSFGDANDKGEREKDKEKKKEKKDRS